MNRTDLVDPDGGLLATFDRETPLAVFQREGDGEQADLRLDARPLDEVTVELSGELVGAWRSSACAVSGHLVRGDDKREVGGFGAVTEARPVGGNGASASGDSADAVADPAVLRRSIAILFEDGDLLAVSAARPAGAAAHDTEEILAGYTDPDGEKTEFTAARLSTEYGPDGAQRRATLELWPGPAGSVSGAGRANGAGGSNGLDGPWRSGGRVLAATSIDLPGAHSWLAFFEWSVDGRPGIGRYEIIRAR